jgi:hypothetical protein
MKVRNGFVSNSSSSNFLVVGVELNKHLTKVLEDQFCKKPDEDLRDALEENFPDFGYIYTDTVSFFGEVKYDTDELYNVPTQIITVKDIQNIAKKLEKVFKEPVDVKIISGERPS